MVCLTFNTVYASQNLLIQFSRTSSLQTGLELRRGASRQVCCGRIWPQQSCWMLAAVSWLVKITASLLLFSSLLV